MMHQSEFDAANVALSRAADKRKSLINIHKNRYTATLTWIIIFPKKICHTKPTFWKCLSATKDEINVTAARANCLGDALTTEPTLVY